MYAIIGKPQYNAQITSACDCHLIRSYIGILYMYSIMLSIQICYPFFNLDVTYIYIYIYIYTIIYLGWLNKLY